VFDHLPLWNLDKYLRKEYRTPYVQQEGTFWRRSLWDRAGGYVSRYFDLAGDLELWARFFRYARLYSVDALLAGYRRHQGQKMASQLECYNKEAELILDREIAGQCSQTRHLPPPLPILFSEQGRPMR
jgi:hypothetical protein